MKTIRRIIQLHPLLFALLTGLLIIVASGLIITASLQFWPERLFHFQSPAPETLEDDTDINGWMTYDKSSYHLGESALVQIRVLYRTDKIIPDFDSLDNSISFFPFDEQSLGSTLEQIDEDITEYTTQYRLQAVRTNPSSRYNFSPLALYYRLTDRTDNNVYLLQIQPPPANMASYYPEDVSVVPFQELRGKVSTVDQIRTPLMLFNGAGLLILALFIIIRFGRKRHVKELTRLEQLWRELHDLDTITRDNRSRLLDYEKLFTQMIQARTGNSPAFFWSGALPDDSILRPVCLKARQILSGNYTSYMSEDEAVREMKRILSESLSNMVEEARLRTEQEPSFINRIRNSPGAQSSIIALILLSTITFALAALPHLWISSEIKRFNLAVDNLNSDTPEYYLEFLALGDEFENQKTRAAALYNAGTARADQAFADASPAQRRVVLPAIFLSDTAEALMHSLLDGPFLEETEIVTLLLNAAEYHRRAQLDLQAASRISPDDQDTGRNLELVTKRYNAILLRLEQIRSFYEEISEEEAISDQGIVDLLNAELPDEEEDESVPRDDRGYLILERF